MFSNCLTAPVSSGCGVYLGKMCLNTNRTKGRWHTGQGTWQEMWDQLGPHHPHCPQGQADLHQERALHHPGKATEAAAELPDK